MEQTDDTATAPQPDGYRHSVKVPDKYKTASKFISNAVNKGVSLKTQLYHTSNERKRSLVYTLIRKIVQYKSVLDQIIKATKILKKEPRLDPHLCLVLTAELLFGNGLKDKSKPSQCILGYSDELFQRLEANKSVIEEIEKKETAQPTPRYVRVNTNLMSRAEAIEQFTQDGWEDVTGEYSTYDEFLTAAKNLGVQHYLSDIHVQNLFVFPWSSKQFWARHWSVKSCKIILQDKASCLSAFLLDPHRGGTVLDMCAAPGMKTTHMAAIMKNRGTIYAVEYNDMRYITLNEFVGKTKSTIVKPIIGDAMTIHQETLDHQVEYILLDPPCSGSGMDNRLSLLNKSIKKKLDGGGDRLFQLGGLQIRLLCHAMKDFPNARRIVYSTCSTNEEENEHVIQRAFEMYPDEGWELVKPLAFAEKWKNFGNPKYKHIGKKCIYAVPEIDQTTGFFVAMLERNFGDKPESYQQAKLPPQVWQSLANNVFGSSNGAASFGTPVSGNPFARIHQEEITPDTALNKQNETHVEPVVEANPENYEENGEPTRKKKKKDKAEAEEPSVEEIEPVAVPEKKSKKKKSKEKHLEVVDESEAIQSNGVELPEKKKKKSKKSIDESLEIVECAPGQPETESTEVQEKKKKKKKSKSEADEPEQLTTVMSAEIDTELPEKKKHKNEKKKNIETPEIIDVDSLAEGRTKVKKSKSKSKEIVESNVSEVLDLTTPEPKRKKRKAHDVSVDDVQVVQEIADDAPAKKKKKKKDKKENHDVNCEETEELPAEPRKKKKKSKHNAEDD